MKEVIHSIILNSKDPVNELDIYFTEKISKNDNAWATAVLILFLIVVLLTEFIINR